jgi:hypothetical protein
MDRDHLCTSRVASCLPPGRQYDSGSLVELTLFKNETTAAAQYTLARGGISSSMNRRGSPLGWRRTLKELTASGPPTRA